MITLSNICQGDSGLVAGLGKWEESLLKSLGLLDILGILTPTDPMEKLYKIRDYIEKQPNGAILFRN